MKFKVKDKYEVGDKVEAVISSGRLVHGTIVKVHKIPERRFWIFVLSPAVTMYSVSYVHMIVREDGSEKYSNYEVERVMEDNVFYQIIE